ncbi:KpsF/GutQ family sugar-phosphate isomerase [Akkermansiaceae bacterium]|nr:KpsF/GutQ family sugar-phosphate isomerase [Akkermansiaceae bacterium]
MSDSITKAQKVIDIEVESLLLMKEALDDNFSHAIEILKEAALNDKKVIVIGVGKSGNVGHKISATLNSTGIASVVLNAQNALHGDLGIVSKDDVILALSYSGETQELLILMPHLKKKGVKLISITGKKDSTLAGLSDSVLITPIKQEACPLGLAPTSSSTSALVMGDALAMTLLDARGFTEDQFASYHPGGSLGKALLTRVEDIMRSGEQMAFCFEASTVMDAIKSMSEARSGSCMIVSGSKKLIGLFSHGDFARAYQQDPDIGGKKVVDYMTPNPITLLPQLLAAEAIHLLKQHKVDDIPVIGVDGTILGLVDSQDFARLKLI